MDNLVDCKRCGGNACYEQKVNDEITTWLCMGCGFTSSTVMTEGSQPVTNIIETSPELYKDLITKDKDGLIWSPATITLPGKGMVFIDGSSIKEWKWSAVKAIPLTEEEKKSGRYPEDQEVKMDMKNAQTFGQKEFMDALEIIGFYEVN